MISHCVIISLSVSWPTAPPPNDSKVWSIGEMIIYRGKAAVLIEEHAGALLWSPQIPVYLPLEFSLGLCSSPR